MPVCCSVRRSPIRLALTAAAAAATSLAFAIAPNVAQAQVTVPSLLAATEGNNQSNVLVFSVARTYQTQIAASELTFFANGGQINGLSYRMNNNSTGPVSNRTFSSYQVTLSQAANAIGSFSTTFEDNIGANAATVYDAALTLTAASFSNVESGTTPEAFGPTVTFTSGYVYQGGDLVITIRHSGNAASSPNLDATNSAAQGYGTLIVAQSANVQNATTSTASGTATVLRLNGVAAAVAAAPEPGTLALLALGGLPLAEMVVRRRRSA